MSSHFLSSHYGGSHHLSSHYGRGVVIVVPEEPGSSFGTDHAGRLRKIKDDDDAIMAIIVAFLDVKDR